jgi:hypothetical protein
VQNTAPQQAGKGTEHPQIMIMVDVHYVQNLIPAVLFH